jgi:hypothetical protein
MTDVLRPATARASEASGRPGRDFSEDQKESFRSLAGSMSFVGVCLILFGGLLAAFAAVALYAGFPWGALGLVVVAVAYVPTGWWTMSAGRSLSGIVRTRGGDLDYLMEAVGQLRRLFAFVRAIIIVQTLLATALAGAFTWCTIASDKASKCWATFG